MLRGGSGEMSRGVEKRAWKSARRVRAPADSPPPPPPAPAAPAAAMEQEGWALGPWQSLLQRLSRRGSRTAAFNGFRS